MTCLDCRYQVIILQDPKEAKHALSSAPILAKSINGARLIIGEIFNPIELLGHDWQEDSLLVFPNEDSLSSETAIQKDFKFLILLDGTWRKVARLMHLNPWLAELPSFAINTNKTSEYKIRKSPRDDGLSTIEAAVFALNELHTDKEFNSMLSAFDKMITLQIEAMGNDVFQANYNS